MADSNYNMIRPVESLQNVAGLTPVKERKERNRQEEQKEKTQHEHEQIPDQVSQAEPENETEQQQSDPNSIDYCAWLNGTFQPSN